MATIAQDLKVLLDSLTEEDKIAMVCSGGGSKGSWQIGACKQIHDYLPYPPKFYLGTSTGANNAIGMAYNGVDKTLQDWRDIKGRSDIFKQANFWDWAQNILFDKELDGLNDWGPLYLKLIDTLTGKQLLPDTEAIITKVDLNGGSLKYAYASKMRDINEVALAVCASSAVPGHTKPVDYRWIDGGVREQTPLKKAIDSGCNVIFVVLANPYTQDPSGGFDMMRLPKRLRLFKIILRSLSIVSHEIMINDLFKCRKKNGEKGFKKIRLVTYAPLMPLHDSDNFDPKVLNAAIEMGLQSEPILIDLAGL